MLGEGGLRILKRVVTWASLRKRLIRDLKEVIREPRTCGEECSRKRTQPRLGGLRGPEGESPECWEGSSTAKRQQQREQDAERT